MRVAKCDFMKSEMKFLGHVVSEEGVNPDPKAVAKLRGWKIPRDKMEMQSFLVFANYYRSSLGMPNLLLLCTPSLVGMPLSRGGLNNSWPSTKSRMRSSRRLLSRSQTRKVNLFWTLTPVPWGFLVSYTNGKVPRRQTSTTPCLRQQEVDRYPRKVRGSQIGNVHRLPLHCQEPQLFVPAMDNGTREVPLPCGTPTTDTTSQCRRFVQTDQ